MNRTVSKKPQTARRRDSVYPPSTDQDHIGQLPPSRPSLKPVVPSRRNEGRSPIGAIFYSEKKKKALKLNSLKRRLTAEGYSYGWGRVAPMQVAMALTRRLKACNITLQGLHCDPGSFSFRFVSCWTGGCISLSSPVSRAKQISALKPRGGALWPCPAKALFCMYL